MKKIDLITGFLGSGKTTFLIQYAKFLLAKGYKVAVVENDFGAVNVDALLVDELRDLGILVEMVQGGCDYDCHYRRFRTKLIALAMQGYNYVLVEPSGIYDTDEFFDCLNDDVLYEMYEIGNIISIVSNDIDMNMDKSLRYILMNECSRAGKIVLSKSDLYNNDKIIDYINSCLEEFESDRRINETNCISSNGIYDNNTLEVLSHSGYREAIYKKMNIDLDKDLESIYFLDKDFTLNDIDKLMSLFSSDYGDVLRIKGCILDNGNYYNINLTKISKSITLAHNGQKIMIIIGKKLNKDNINIL